MADDGNSKSKQDHDKEDGSNESEKSNNSLEDFVTKHYNQQKVKFSLP